MLITRLLRGLLFSDKERNAIPEKQLNPDADNVVSEYTFTSDWTSIHFPIWTAVLDQLPAIDKILEIGSYEGRSTVWLIENAFKATGKGEIFCIDTWEGGVEHRGIDMPAVEERFIRNVEIAKSRAKAEITINRCRGTSFDQLVSLITNGHRSSFDVIYVDGSHQCADVLMDLVLSFQLCKVGGLIMCDDYLWRSMKHGHENLLDQPKLAIDSFVNCYMRKLLLMDAPLYQLYIKKTSD